MKTNHVTKAWKNLTDEQKRIYVDFGAHDNARMLDEDGRDGCTIQLSIRGWHKKRLNVSGKLVTLDEMVPLSAKLLDSGKLRLEPSMSGPSPEGIAKRRGIKVATVLRQIRKIIAREAIETDDIYIEIFGAQRLVKAFLASDHEAFKKVADKQWAKFESRNQLRDRLEAMYKPKNVYTPAPAGEVCECGKKHRNGKAVDVVEIHSATAESITATVRFAFTCGEGYFDQECIILNDKTVA